MKELLSINEFKERYSVSRSTVYRLAERGDIALVKVGRSVRIRATEAQQWSERLTSGKR